jgi:diaminopimelate epimerase
VRARAGEDAMVTLHGNATWEWEGEVEVDLVRARAGDLTVLRHFDDEIAAWARAVE